MHTATVTQPYLGNGRKMEAENQDSIAECTDGMAYIELIDFSPPSLGSGVCVEKVIEHDESTSLLTKRDTDQEEQDYRRMGLPAKARKMKVWERWFLLLALTCVVLMHRLYAQLEQSSMEYIEESGIFDHASADDWYLLQRAGVWSRQYNMRASTQPHPLVGHTSKSKTKGCFFLDEIGRAHV